MVSRYTVKNVSTLETPSSTFRNVTLEAGGHSLNHFSKCTERTADYRTLRASGDGRVLNECYLYMSPNRLRELGDDREVQDRYILDHCKFRSQGLVNVLMIKLRIQATDRLEDSDYDTLNSLLTWGDNDIYVMPLLEFGEGIDRIQMIERYEEFVSRMLETKNSWIDGGANVGMSIPQLYPKHKVEDLFGLYGDESPAFVAIDFNNGCMDNAERNVGPVIRHFGEIDEEDFFLYGVNVKPYRRGPDEAYAWDIHMFRNSFNAVGTTHPRLGTVTSPLEADRTMRAFDPHDVKYRILDDQRLDEVIAWTRDAYGVDPGRSMIRLYPYLMRYNFEKSNGYLYDLSEAVKKGDTDLIKCVRACRLYRNDAEVEPPEGFEPPAC